MTSRSVPLNVRQVRMRRSKVRRRPTDLAGGRFRLFVLLMVGFARLVGEGQPMLQRRVRGNDGFGSMNEPARAGGERTSRSELFSTG
jgi:hypothetical protein